MQLTRRPALEEDTDVARRIHHQAYREVVERQFGPWVEAEQDRYFQGDWDNATFEIVLYDGIPSGYLCVEDRATDIHIREIVLSPTIQRQGIGTLLLREVIERARDRRVPIRLATFRDNHALNLYRKLGFREIGQTDIHIRLEWHDTENQL
jgi:ribosomal protein S18 acetylase RimI-like enzyme